MTHALPDVLGDLQCMEAAKGPVFPANCQHPTGLLRSFVMHDFQALIVAARLAHR